MLQVDATFNFKAVFEQFKRDPNDFLRRVVTVNETCIHRHTPEIRQQSKSAPKSAPKNAQTIPSYGKVMMTFY